MRYQNKHNFSDIFSHTPADLGFDAEYSQQPLLNIRGTEVGNPK